MLAVLHRIFFWPDCLWLSNQCMVSSQWCMTEVIKRLLPLVSFTPDGEAQLYPVLRTVIESVTEGCYWSGNISCLWLVLVQVHRSLQEHTGPSAPWKSHCPENGQSKRWCRFLCTVLAIHWQGQSKRWCARFVGQTVTRTEQKVMYSFCWPDIDRQSKRWCTHFVG